MWYPLYYAVKGKYRLFCKVRLADVVECPPGRADARRWFKRITPFVKDFSAIRVRPVSAGMSEPRP